MRKVIGILVAVVVLALSAAGALWLRHKRQIVSAGPAAPTTAVPGANLAAAPAPAAPPDPAALLAKANALYEQVSVNQYDVEPLAARLSSGVDPAFAFVRDSIRYEPYAGVMRGAEGALAGKAANACDRSLLLARLLAAQNVTTRFAIGTLSAEQSARLFGHVFDVPKPPPGAAARPAQQPSDDFWQRVAARGDRDYRAITAAYHQPSAASDRDAIMKTIARHVWVQAQINGTWTDLDTAFPDAVPGKAFAEAESTFDELPDDWHQRITARVVVERLEGTELTRTSVLEVTRPAVDLVDRDIFLVHTPDTGGSGGMLSIGSGRSGDGWRPTLWFDGESVQGDAINFSDQSHSGGSFDALAGGGGDTASPFVAEWLEFEIMAPDGSRVITRRVLTDRAGEAWRSRSAHDASALRPLEMAGDTPAAAQTLHNIWITAGRHNLAHVARRTLLLMLPVPDGAAAPDPSEEAMEVVALQNLSTLIWSDHVIVPSLDDVPGVHMYVGSPRITIVSQGPSGAAADRVTEIYDLRRDAIAGVARDAAGDAVVRDRKLRFGAMEGALEHEASARDFAPLGPTVSIVSTSSLLGGDGATVIRPADGSKISGLSSDEETRARIARALGNGEVLVAPTQALRSGPPAWWAIAPDGNTRAVLGPDLNVSMAKGGAFRLNSGGGTKSLGTTARRAWDASRTPQLRPGESLQDGVARMLREDAAARKRDKARGGTEYINIVKVVAVGTISFATTLAFEHEYEFQKMQEQLAAVSAAANAGR